MGSFELFLKTVVDTAVYRWVAAPCLNQLSTAEFGADASLVRRNSLVQVWFITLESTSGIRARNSLTNRGNNNAGRGHVTEPSNKAAAAAEKKLWNGTEWEHKSETWLSTTPVFGFQLGRNPSCSENLECILLTNSFWRFLMYFLF